MLGQLLRYVIVGKREENSGSIWKSRIDVGFSTGRVVVCVSSTSELMLQLRLRNDRYFP